ncbi:unnamed protein product [marine sediment metagenome]|uniref:Uncharacterized protein n=1 Tax=marine sediment metagenome TaxID=412755 RepID=X0WHA6_9ZZZZ
MDSETLCLVSLNAYHRISKDSFFRRVLEANELEPARNSFVFHGFSKLSELAKESKDYLIILKLIEQDVDGVYGMLGTGNIEKFREKFEKLKSETGSEILEKFEKHFIEEKKKI